MKDFSKEKVESTGFTLIELTIVISVLLGLISVAFVGASAFKEGTNRAQCIQNLVNTQKALRTYVNLYEFEPGDTVTGLKDKIAGPGKFIPIAPNCPSNGAYTYDGGDGSEDTVPARGVAYLRCSIGDHEVVNTASW